MKMTRFGNGFRRLYKLCGLKRQKSCLNVSLALCQTHCRQVPVFPPFSKYHMIMHHTPSSYLRVNMGCALVILFQVRSLYVPTKTGHLYGAISGSP